MPWLRAVSQTEHTHVQGEAETSTDKQKHEGGITRSHGEVNEGSEGGWGGGRDAAVLGTLRWAAVYSPTPLLK